MDSIRVFNTYKDLGYKIIPLYPNSKVPMFSGWQSNYTYERTEKIICSTAENINYGLILGDIIDLEGDCIESNQKLDDLLNGIDHPIFLSNKSKHHLFRSSIKNLTKVEFEGIEVRGHRHQSVIPPSTHIMGCNYEWHTSLLHANEIPHLPEFLYKKIISLLPKIQKKVYKNNIKDKHQKILCQKCKNTSFMNSKRLSKEISILKQNGLQWMCMECRPFDLRKAIRCSNKTLKNFS